MRIHTNYYFCNLQKDYDLDDIENYKHLPNDREELLKNIFYEIGYISWYFKYYNTSKSYKNQEKMFKTIVKDFTTEMKKSEQDLNKLKEYLFLLQLEFDNLL